MKSLFILLISILFYGCGITAKPITPCNGWYCIEVENLPTSVVGDPAFCWHTQAELMQNKAMYEKQGYKVTIK